MVSPIADFVVDMGPDGRIVSQGSLSNALAHDAKLLKELQQEQEEMEKAKEEIDEDFPEDETAKQNAGKLIVEEETEFGHVGWKACESLVSRAPAGLRKADHACLCAVWLYLGNMSTRPIWFWFCYIGIYVIRHGLTNGQVSTFHDHNKIA